MFNGLGPKIVTFFFAMVLATTALSDITPKEAFEHMIDRFKASDFTVSGVTLIDGDTLHVSDLVFKNDKFFDGISLEYAANTWSFTQQDGGNVLLKMTEDSNWKIDFKSADNAFLSVHIGQSIKGGEYILSQNNDQIKEDFFFETLSFNLLKLVDNSGEISEDQLQVSIKLKDFSGISHDAKASKKLVTAEIDVGKLFVNTLVSPAEGNFSVSWNSAFSNLQLFSSSKKQTDTLVDRSDTALISGLSRSLQYSYDIGQTTINYSDQKDNALIASESNEGSFSADLSSSASNFVFNISPWDVNLEGSLFPVPVAFSILSLVHNALLPTIASEGEQKVSIGFSIQELAFSESFWDRLDPLKFFDRDTFNFNLDLEAFIHLIKGYKTAEWTDKIEFNNFYGIAELLSLSINEFAVSGLGAKFSVDGAFSFDNDDYITFEGIPRPEGDIRLSFKGLNNVLQKLSTAGVIGSEEVMGAKMLLGMFTIAVGMDELEAELWIDPTGAIYANGQRIQ